MPVYYPLIFLPTVFLILFLTGCTGTQPAEYSQYYIAPKITKIENQRSVPLNYNDTWEKVVSQISDSTYFINNIDKENGLIKLSFPNPNIISDYAHCGISKISFSLDTIIEDKSYKTADQSANYMPPYDNTTDGVSAFFLKKIRHPSLEINANIYIYPNEETTTISVNAMYLWTVNVSYEHYSYNTWYKTLSLRNRSSQTLDPISFNTNSENLNKNGLTCFSTGKFENDLLAIIDS